VLGSSEEGETSEPSLELDAFEHEDELIECVSVLARCLIGVAFQERYLAVIPRETVHSTGRWFW
jgi:hypothetical protein